jgi:transposase-like protein
MEMPDSLRDAILYFEDFEHCREFMVELRWADGKPKCPRCGSDHILWIPKERVWKCYGKHDHAKFSLKTGTVLEDSPLGLDKWLPAAWLVINCKNGISSYELSRALKVSQKSAWFMLHRVRLALQSGTFNKLSGEVEVDESFIGGKARNMHAAKRARKITGTGGKDKVVVMGIMERGGQVRAMVVDGRRKKELQKTVREHVEAGAAIFSDELKSYEGLAADYQHAVINHAVEYVRENVHTNGLENFWSLLKRGLHGTYISVEPFHLFRYIDEQAFRFNTRKLTDAERFCIGMKQIVGKRLTYRELTGKTESEQSEMRPAN